jgi:hypothetical protein
MAGQYASVWRLALIVRTQKGFAIVSSLKNTVCTDPIAGTYTPLSDQTGVTRYFPLEFLAPLGLSDIEYATAAPISGLLR